MTTDVSSLAISVDSRQVAQADAALTRFAAAGTRAERSITSTEVAARSLSGTLGTVISALSVAKVVQYADAYQQVNARLRLVTDGQAAYNRVQAELVQQANLTRSSLAGTLDLYARIARSTKSLAASDGDRLRVTETINKALIVSGASGASAQAALIQLGQGLASGTLRGEELNSVLEQAPRLAEAIAAGIGKSVGELRKFAAEGKLTSSVVFEALKSQGDAIDREFSRIPVTIGQALQVAENNLQQFIGGTSEASGAGLALGRVIVGLSQNIDLITAAAAGLGATKLAQIFIGTLAAAKNSVAAALANAEALHAQRLAASAATAAEAQRTAAVVSSAAADRAASVQKLAGLQTTQAVIVQARAEALARLQAANATLAQASAQIQAARSAGALSSAIAARAAGEVAATAATARQAAAIRDLAALGKAQAGVQAGITAATAAQTAATASLTTAQTAQAAAARGLAASSGAAAAAGTIASRALGLLGGPIGLITTLLGLGATAWVLWGNEAEASADKAGEALQRNLGRAIVSAQTEVNNLDRQIRVSLESGFAADSSRVKALEGRRDALRAEIDAARTERAKIDKERARNDAIERNERARRVDPVAIKNRQTEALKEFLTDNATDAEKFAAAVKKAKSELGDLFTPELEARLRKRFLSKGDAKGKDLLGFDLDKIQAELSKLTSAYSSSEQILEAQRAASLVDERTYYDAKLGFVRLNTEAQIASLEQENKRLAAQKGNAAELLKNQRDIAANEAKIAILRAQGASQETVLGIQRTAAADSVRKALIEARAAAEEYLGSLTRAQNIEIAGAGLGNAARDRARSRQAIEDRYLEQRQRLAAELRQGQITRARYDDELRIIEEFQGRALAIEAEGQRARLRLQGDFTVGAREALANYLDEIKNVAKRSEELFGNAIRSIEGEFVSLFTKGKFDFGSLLESIGGDVIRNQVRTHITGPLFEEVQNAMRPGAGGLGGLLQRGLGAVFGSAPGAAPITPIVPPQAGGAAADAVAGAASAAAASAAQTAAITASIASASAAETAAITASIASASAAETASITASIAAASTADIGSMSAGLAASSAARTAALGAAAGAIVSAIASSTASIVAAVQGAAVTGGGSDILGAIGSAFGFADLGFEGGGWTGDAPTNKVVGPVHGKEFVFSAPAVRTIGVGALDRMHRLARRGAAPSGLRGFADGGFAGKPQQWWAGASSSPSGASARVGDVNVNIHGAPSTPKVQKRQRADGGVDIDVMFDQMEQRLGERIGNGVGLARAVGGRFGMSDGGALMR
jgi:lambda family phage tail tape measure protein